MKHETAAGVEQSPERIWLSPICDLRADHGEGRSWAAPAPEGECDDCGEPWVAYVRADLTPAHPIQGGEVERLRDWLDSRGTGYTVSADEMRDQILAALASQQQQDTKIASPPGGSQVGRDDARGAPEPDPAGDDGAPLLACQQPRARVGREDIARVLADNLYAFATDDDGDCGEWEDMSKEARKVYLITADAILSLIEGEGR